MRLHAYGRQSGHVYMVSPAVLLRSPPSSTLLLSSSRSPQLSVVNSRRSFIASPHLESEFLDDFKEMPDKNARSRVRRVQSITLMQRGQGTMIRDKISSRAQQITAQERKAAAEALRKNIDMIVAQCSPLDKLIVGLVSNYIELKYSPPAARISRSAVTIQALKKEQLKVEHRLRWRLDFEALFLRADTVRPRISTFVQDATEYVEHVTANYRKRWRLQFEALLLRADTVQPRISTFVQDATEFVEHVTANYRKRWRLEFEALLSKADTVQPPISTFVQDATELVEAQLSARRRVDADMIPLAQIQAGYNLLSELGNAIASNLSRMDVDIRSVLKEAPSLRSHLGKYCAQLQRYMTEFSARAHLYRAAILRRQTYQYFDGTLPFTLLINRGERQIIREDMVKFDKGRKKREKQEDLLRNATRTLDKDPSITASRPCAVAGLPYIYKLGYSQQLEAFYFPNSRSVCHRQLDLHHQQLDTMAPFLLAHLSGLKLGFLARNLITVLRSRPETKGARRQIKDLHEFSFKFRDHRASYSSILQQVWRLNWMRLEASNRLLKLGVPDDFKERGLFCVSKRLTQDRALFSRWATRMAAEEFKAERLLTVSRSRPIAKQLSRTRLPLPRQHARLSRRALVAKPPSRTRLPTRQWAHGRQPAPVSKPRSRIRIAPSRKVGGSHKNSSKPEGGRPREIRVSKAPALGSSHAKKTGDRMSAIELSLPSRAAFSQPLASGPWKMGYSSRGPGH